MYRDWNFLVFNATESDFKSLRGLQQNISVSYACYTTYTVHSDVFTVGFVRFFHGFVSPSELFSPRAWLKPCHDAEESLKYIQYSIDYTEYGNFEIDPLDVLDDITCISTNENKDST